MLTVLSYGFKDSIKDPRDLSHALSIICVRPRLSRLSGAPRYMHEIKKKKTLEPQRLIYGFTKTLHRCPLVTINETFDISMNGQK